MSKKEVEQLKAKIYQQVEQLEDEKALELLGEALAAYSTISKKDIVDELNTEQQLRLKESIQQIKDGKTVSNDAVKQKAKEWLSK